MKFSGGMNLGVICSSEGRKNMLMDEIVKGIAITAGYKNKPILEKVSFSIRRGELVGIIGPNGAGKSTLLKTLRGFLPLCSGAVVIDNQPIEKITVHEFACQVAYLQQYKEFPFGYTTQEIVLAGRYPYIKWWQRESEHDQEIVKGCMEYTGVWDLANQTMQEISGGQRQRVLLAKVLAQQTPLLFLDEPTTGLDIFYQEEIFRLCRSLCQAKKTVVMIAHELSLAARFCTRLLLIGQGRIIADGTAVEVLTEENLTLAYGIPVHVVTNPLTGTPEIYTIGDASNEVRRQKLLPMMDKKREELFCERMKLRRK